jgi:hypothetical protein
MMAAETCNGVAEPQAKRPRAEPENEHFRVEEADVTDADGVRRRRAVVMILTHEGARAARSHAMSDDSRVPPFAAPLGLLLAALPAMRGQDYPAATPDLVRALEPASGHAQAELDELRAHGRIQYGLLWLVFAPNALVAWDGRSGDPACGVVVRAKYGHGDGRMPEFTLELRTLAAGRDDAHFETVKIQIPEFGECSLSELPFDVRPLDEADPLFARLVARGHRWLSLARGVHVMECAGTLVTSNWLGDTTTSARGRCVVDVFGSALDAEMCSGRACAPAQVREPRTVATAPASLPAYSLVLHQWGAVRVDDLSETVYNRAAFDELVLPPARKEAVRAIVDGGAAVDLPDIIAGKGGGAVVLLYGPPGTGKTLTAEAVAEHLERPLLFVRAAVLAGGKAGEALSRFLQLAQRWNGVVLIDEADVLLMRRDAGNATRNAAVAAMLVVLERHSGVVFLTTNRVGDFDAAVASRINFGLKYEPLSEDDRRAVWSVQLRKAAGRVCLLDGQDMLALDEAAVQEWARALAPHPINGRVIRTAIKIACSTAWHRKAPLALDTLRQVVAQQVAFQADVGDDAGLAHE